MTPPVPMHGCESALSTQYTGPLASSFRCPFCKHTSEHSPQAHEQTHRHQLVDTDARDGRVLLAAHEHEARVVRVPRAHLAMNTAMTFTLRAGFFSASCVHISQAVPQRPTAWRACRKRSVMSATCPRQSVVPRPYSLSPLIVSWNGSTVLAHHW